MNAASKHLLLTTGLAMVLACGGGGGGSTSPGSTTPPASHTLQVTVRGAASWAAFQDGSGSWTALALTNGTASQTIQDRNGRYGLAVGYLNTAGYKVTQIWQSTLAESSSILVTVPGSEPVTLSGSVTGLSASEVAFGSYGKTFASSGTNTGFTVNVEPGKADLVVSAWDTTYGRTDLVWIQRGLTFNASTTVPTVNMAAGTSLTPVAATITGANPYGTQFLFGDWYTQNGTFVGLSGSSFSGGPYSAQILPASALAAGEVQDANVEDYDTASIRLASTYFTSSSSLSLSLPSGFSGSLTYGSGPAAQWSSFPGARIYAGRMRQTASTTLVYFTLSAGWVGSGSTHSYQVPDVMGTFGSWFFASGQNTTWYFGAEGSSYDPKTINTVAQPFKVGDSDWISLAQGALVPMAPGGSSDLAPARPSPLTHEEVIEAKKALLFR